MAYYLAIFTQRSNTMITHSHRTKRFVCVFFGSFFLSSACWKSTRVKWQNHDESEKKATTYTSILKKINSWNFQLTNKCRKKRFFFSLNDHNCLCTIAAGTIFHWVVMDPQLSCCIWALCRCWRCFFLIEHLDSDRIGNIKRFTIGINRQ